MSRPARLSLDGPVAPHARIRRHGDRGTRSNCYMSCRLVVWSGLWACESQSGDKNGSRHWRGGIQLARGASQQSGRRCKPSRPDPRPGPRVGNRHAHRQLRLSEQNAAVLWRPGRSERSRQTAIGLGGRAHFWAAPSDLAARRLRDPVKLLRVTCRVVVWSVFRACGRQLCDKKVTFVPCRACCELYEPV